MNNSWLKEKGDPEDVLRELANGQEVRVHWGGKEKDMGEKRQKCCSVPSHPIKRLGVGSPMYLCIFKSTFQSIIWP